MIDFDDDLGTAVKPFKVLAVIPVLGRLPLLKFTIERLYRKNHIYKVICVGSSKDERQLCESLGALWVDYKNVPLAEKWNRGFQETKQYDPDACVFVGSSDWISDNWIAEMKPHLQQYDLIGTHGCHFLHLGNKENQLCYWPGYHKQRKGESIGIGRLLSRSLLDKLHFKPFNDQLHNSLDGSMQQRSSEVAGRLHVVGTHLIKSVSISTDLWENKHKFSEHWTNLLPSQKIEDVDNWIEINFPEAKILCESLKVTSVKA
jgi:hypothetical protein